MLRASLAAAVALALLGTAQAQTPSRIGVTQTTENNPMGKPPAGPDRILRVGTDIQANETVTTKAEDRAHLVFLDGTTVTIGPNSQLTIDKFVYDPTTQKGELAMNVSRGVFRVIGGRISKTSDITVATPSATMGIRGGIIVSDVTSTSTTSLLVFGSHLTVKATVNGTDYIQRITVPGLGSVTHRGFPPGPPTVLQGSLSTALASLVTNAQTAAAVSRAIQTLVASNIGNAMTLATVLQTIINVAAADTRTTTTTTITQDNKNVVVVENPNQCQGLSCH